MYISAYNLVQKYESENIISNDFSLFRKNTCVVDELEQNWNRNRGFKLLWFDLDPNTKVKLVTEQDHVQLQ